MSKSKRICYNISMSTRKQTGRSPAKKSRPSRKRSTTKKTSKVYIPPYKAIILCLSVIVICLILLLISTLSKGSSKSLQEEEVSSITERFESETENKATPEISLEKRFDHTPETKQIETKKTEVKKEEKKTEPKKEEKEAVKKTETEESAVTQSKSREEKKPQAKKADFGLEKARNKAQLVFVFDDGGQNLEQLKKFLELPFPITVAVLPQITHSVEAADLVRKSGNEVILHQPMQSVNANINPGPGAITPDMTEAQVIAQLFVNIDQISPIAGMNNHEGSGITADAQMMEIILKTAEQAGIYFLDSRTNVETTVPYVAGELGYSYYERNIFLDNEKTRENALTELKKGLALANKNGSVIMIGHIWSADFLPALLKEVYPELKEKGYTFSVVSASKAKKN